MAQEDQLVVGKDFLFKHDVSEIEAIGVFKIMHPEAAVNTWITGALLMAAVLSKAPTFETDKLAPYLADTYGAFPWKGPVGNGLSKQYYQSRFTEMAEEYTFFATVLNIPEPESPSDD